MAKPAYYVIKRDDSYFQTRNNWTSSQSNATKIATRNLAKIIAREFSESSIRVVKIKNKVNMPAIGTVFFDKKYYGDFPLMVIEPRNIDISGTKEKLIVVIDKNGKEQVWGTMKEWSEAEIVFQPL